jgi:hypothetical protein
MASRWFIMAHRTQGSILGASSARLKENGREVAYDSFDQAKRRAHELNKMTRSPNVFYTAEGAAG